MPRDTNSKQSEAPIVEAEKAYLERKERAMCEDLRTAFAGYDHLMRQIGEIRVWMVTVEVAAIGLAISKSLPYKATALTSAVARWWPS
jgi:hypothetical protein